MAVNVIKRTWLQDRMVRPETLNGMAFQAEAGAHRFEITGYDSNGNIMAFSGNVTAIFLRPDNTDVPLTGVILNGVAQVTLSQECYQVPGRFGLAIFVNSGNTKTVVYKCIGPVGMTSSGVEASSVVQSVSTLIDRIEAAVNSIPQDYSALNKAVSATCPEMRDGSTGNPWNTDSITTKYVIKIDKSCDELILEYIGSTQAQYYVFGYSVFNGVADGTESYAARTSAASFLDYPEKYVQTEPYVIIPVSQLGDYTHIAIVLWAKSDETTFIPLRIATEQNNLRVTFRHASYMGHEEINNRSVKVGVQNASKMASPLKLVHFSDLHRDVNALNRIRASAKYVCPNADNIICTGDMVANTYAEITSWWIPEIMTCIGNHDTASYDGTYDWTALTMAQRDEMYISPFKSYWGIVHTSGTSYYYKDYTAAHIRLIVMDAMLYSGTPGAEATAQTQWLANLLASAITDSLHVIIAIHAPHGGSVPVACSFTKLGQETMPVNVDCNTPDVVINTVATAIGNGLHFIGYICGHTHQDAIWDCTGDRSQLMYTVTCAAVDQTAQWIDSDQYRTDEQDAFNVLTIDTASTTIKILRGGGANTDVALRPRVSMVINYSTGKIITDTYASGTQDAVVYGEAQDLTDAQKAQARANVGAGSAADVAENTADITANAEEITSLKSAVVNKTAMANCQIVSIPASANRCNMDAIIPNTTINWYTGVTSENTNHCLYSMDINPGDILYLWALHPDITVVSASGWGFSTYDINGNHTRQGTGTYYHEYTVPENVYRLVIILNQNWVNSGYKYIILINDSTQPTSYEPYADAHDEYVAKNEFLASASVVGEKKILIDAFPQSRYFNYNGLLYKNANFLTTDYIRVYENDVINAAGYSYVDTNPNTDLRTNVVSFFGEDFSYISGVYSTESSGLVTVEDASVPQGAKYVVFGKHTSLEASNSYAYITRQYANIKKTAGEDVPIRVLPVLPVKKTISILGDSISQGEVATDRPNDSYAGILRQLFGLEYGNHMNYGFVSMSRAKDMVYLTNWSGWTETTGSTTAIGGDEYATTTAGSKLTFRIGKQFSKVKIATKFGSGYGTLTLAQGDSVLGVIDCSTGDGAGFSEAIDISSADFSQAFTISASGSASVSGLVLIDDDDYWTFMNYGRSGAAASVFTGDTFDIQTDADIVIYALGVNGTARQLLSSLNDIKARFLGSDAHKIVLDLNFTTAQWNGAAKHSVLKQFAHETGSEYICVWDYVPKDATTGYVADGFLNTDGIHPIDAGHQFIAELVAKEISLSVNSKEIAQEVLNTKITWSVN